MTISRSVLIVALLAALVAGCEDAERTVGELVEQAEDTVELVEFCRAAAETVTAINERDLDQAMNGAESMVAEAPEEIADQAHAVFEGVEAAQQGDTEAVESEEFQQAARELESYTRENCDPSS